MYRTREYRRAQSRRVIARKEKIIRDYAEDSLPAKYDAKRVNPRDIPYLRDYGSCDSYWRYKSPHQLSKGKIHCSCPMCTFHGTPMQDKRQYEKMLYDLRENGMEDTTASERLVKKIRGRYYPSHSGGARVFQKNANFADYVGYIATTAVNQFVVESDPVETAKDVIHNYGLTTREVFEEALEASVHEDRSDGYLQQIKTSKRLNILSKAI